ncbi:protein kinase domain-containing protein, partial [Kribbella karoonensis]|uniref:protein kinase domain-containing protein n=1 Tax=Kribbella karoonensis TaxID=324851 RepID=UPI0031CFC210
MDLADLAGYSLRRQLGSGSAGTVWQVRDRATGRNAVLKHIPAGALPDSHRVREDLTKLAHLRHPHLARLVEFRETDTGWLLISQHLAAGTLTALLTRRGPLTKGELVTLLTPLASALSYLHEYGLTHGSITPNNIMFDADGRPILTDPALHAGTPEADTQALSHLAHQAGADPHPFASTLFTTPPLNSIPTRLLTLA